MNAKPWAEPGLSVDQRAGAVVHVLTLQKRRLRLCRLEIVAEAIRAALADQEGKE